jgi:two-component system response regulator RegA
MSEMPATSRLQDVAYRFPPIDYRVASPALAGPVARDPRERDMRTVIYVYAPTMLALTCAEAICISSFPRITADLHLDPGTHELPMEPGVYVAWTDADLATEGAEVDVVVLVGKKLPRPPARIFEALPPLRRGDLVRFLRRPAPAPSAPPREIRQILAVDDDETVLARYERGFGQGRTVHKTTDPAVARELVKSVPFDLAIVELRVHRQSGIALARELKRARPELIVALCSGYLSVDVAVTAVRAGVDLVLFKPVTAREILRRIDAGPPSEPDLDETPTLEAAEWEHIMRVLADCNGNVSMAARRLGIYRSSLQRRLRKSAPRQLAQHLPPCQVASAG